MDMDEAKKKGNLPPFLMKKDPDNDGDDDTTKKGDTDKDFAGKKKGKSTKKGKK